MAYYIQICVIASCVIKGLHSALFCVVGGSGEKVKHRGVTSCADSSSEVLCVQQRWWLTETYEESRLPRRTRNY